MKKSQAQNYVLEELVIIYYVSFHSLLFLPIYSISEPYYLWAFIGNTFLRAFPLVTLLSNSLLYQWWTNSSKTQFWAWLLLCSKISLIPPCSSSNVQILYSGISECLWSGPNEFILTWIIALHQTKLHYFLFSQITQKISVQLTAEMSHCSLHNYLQKSHLLQIRFDHPF